MGANTPPLSSDHSIPSLAAEYKGSDVKIANKPVRVAAEPPLRGPERLWRGRTGSEMKKQ